MSLIYSLGKRIRQEQEDNERKEGETKTVMPREEEETLRGTYLNNL